MNLFDYKGNVISTGNGGGDGETGGIVDDLGQLAFKDEVGYGDLDTDLKNVVDEHVVHDELVAACDDLARAIPTKPGDIGAQPAGNYVQTVNGAAPDENGNVDIEVSGGEGGGTQFETDETLRLENGVLSVNTTDQVEEDNTLPITSAGVYAIVGNVEELLKTI